MFFGSIKEINSLLKETNRLLSKGMSYIYLNKLLLRKTDLKTLLQDSFWRLQLTEIPLTCKTSLCNLKTRGLGKKNVSNYVSFLMFHF